MDFLVSGTPVNGDFQYQGVQSMNFSFAKHQQSTYSNKTNEGE
jgi:hypothetical protein